MRRRNRQTDWPGPLAEFHAEDWGPVEGECLMRYGCQGAPCGEDCRPRPGQYCGQLHYEMLERDFPGDPERLARAKAADCYVRWRLARANWLGENHPGHLTEILGTGEAHHIEYPRPSRTVTPR